MKALKKTRATAFYVSRHDLAPSLVLRQ